MDGKNIIITGQTGAGKTSLAVALAKKTNTVLLSADSRQIYKEMDIGTGKYDDPSDLQYDINTWKLHNIPIYGINLINPDQIYSAGDFAEYGKKIIKDNEKVITIGGTGFYIKSLFLPDATIHIPQNTDLRQKYAQLEKDKTFEQFIQILQHDLNQISPERLATMNNSDRNNPRRLIRAIEVMLRNNNTNLSSSFYDDKNIWIGLYAPKEILLQRITHRVHKMIEMGLEKEVKTLAQKYSWNSPGMQTIGYIEWREYLENKIPKESLIQNIITSQMQYARKQMIYLKRFKHIKWIDISKEDPLKMALHYCQTN